MPPKVAPSTTPASSAGNDASIGETLDLNLQVVTIGQLRAVVE